ncbi:MAG: HAMP domain-containing histidine kinase [Xanthomonadales bacterium]|nr:HAMP domain-containing histidine kinase [Xanthomonadales bacterium]
MTPGLQDSTQRHWKVSNYPSSRALARRVMVYFNIFRFIVAGVILFLVFSSTTQIVQAELLNLARSAAIVYFADSLLMIALLNRNPDQPHMLGRFAFIVDIIVAMVLIYTLDSLSIGTGMLLVFWCCAAAVILPRGFAFTLAAFSSIFIITFTAWDLLLGNASHDLLSAGIYAASCFFGALIFSALARWSQQYELLAEQNVVDLRNMEQINEIVIRRMRAGVVVVDHAGEIRLMNESAWFLLGSPSTSNTNLSAVAPRLMKLLGRWHTGKKVIDEPESLIPGHSPVIPQFITIPGTHSEATLVFLQDTSKVSRQASTIATETLAKLSGSIAHEIRNPLAAMVNASELMQESEKTSTEDKQLLAIITNQGERINNIIENILQLARQKRSRPEVIQLNLELQSLVSEYRQMMPENGLKITLNLLPQPAYVLFDRSQFQQVIHQLLENALTHASQADQETEVTISLDTKHGSGHIILDFEDNGPGISTNMLAKIFEPFYSSHQQGSGLGLYITQQLCNINQTELSVISSSDSGALFRLVIPSASHEQKLAKQAHNQ